MPGSSAIIRFKSSLASARRAALIGIIGSGTLAVLKIVFGTLGGSSAVVADGVESGGDAIASAVVLFGLAISLRPPDDEHPYGHGRAEDIAGKTVATMMLVSGGILLWTNGEELLRQLRTPVPVAAPQAYTVWLMVLSLTVKSAMFFHKLRVGRRLRSMALQADAWNDFTDIVSASAALCGLGLALNGNPWADRAAAVAVSLIIIYTAAMVFRTASAALLDQQGPPELLAELRSLAMGIEGVRGVEKLVARRAGLTYFAEMHLEVDGDMSVRAAHAIGHQVKSRIQAVRPDVADVLVHLEPARG